MTQPLHALSRACLLLLAATTVTSAQELEPRAYSPSPVGANFALVVYNRSTGSIVTDPALPITDVSADVNGVTLGLARTFGAWGRQGLVSAALPYAWGHAEGNVGEDRRAVDRSGLGDLRAKVSINLHGSPALTREAFVKRKKERYLLATSLSISAPTGQYVAERLVNIGSNRWAFKPEIGVSYPYRRFYFDFYAGAWLFTANDRFYPGEARREQDPLTTFQAHISCTIRPGLWVALNSTWYGGGSTSVDGGAPSGRLNNSRLGGTLSYQFYPGQSLKVAYSGGASVSSGSNFKTVAVGWQTLWF